MYNRKQAPIDRANEKKQKILGGHTERTIANLKAAMITIEEAMVYANEKQGLFLEAHYRNFQTTIGDLETTFVVELAAFKRDPIHDDGY